MKISIIIFALNLLLANLALSQELQTRDVETVENYIKSKEKSLSAGEYPQARQFMPGDINHDDIADLSVIYTLESIGGGGNNYSFFLAVFKRTNDGLEFVADAKVGGKGTRSLFFESIEDGVITFTTKFLWKHDALCCPSGGGKAFYILDYRNFLRELNLAPTR